MPIKTVPAKFESHGKEFDTMGEAQRHSAICDARDELEEAQRKFERVLAEGCKTADGHPFRFGVFADYWSVFAPHRSMPHLVHTEYFCNAWRVREHPVNGALEICHEPSDSEKRGRWIEIRYLYAKEANANAALLAAQREWIADRHREIEEFAGKIGMPK